MFKSIRTKLVVSYLILILATLFVVNFSLMRSIRENFLNGERVANLTGANIVANAVEGKTYSEQVAVSENFSAQLGGRILILDRAGYVRVDSYHDDRLLRKKLELPEVATALSGKGTAAERYLEKDGWVMYTVVPTFYKQEVNGAVFFSKDINHIIDTLNEIRWQFFFFSLSIGIIITGLGFFLAENFATPIRELTKAAEKIKGGFLGERVQVRGKDEIAQLSQSFNAMAETIEEVDKSRRNFVSNASHELKTPLASIKVLAEALLHSEEKDYRVYREFLGDINNEMDRLNHLTNDLLDIVKLDEGKEKIHLESTELRSLVEEIIAKEGAAAAKKHLAIGSSISGNLFCKVDRDKIGQVITNLLSNAVKYTDSGGRIEIKAWVSEGVLTIIVEDNGIGIPEEDLPFIFERFYRVDKARARATGGSGLGLFIVKQIVELHRGSIDVESSVGKGTRFTVRIPCDIVISGV